MKRELRERGFTLVELAIVMVIIGVMIGAVLKGQAMIDNARMSRVYSDYGNISAAMFAYYDRYNRNPGDDPTASTRWTGVSNGNGNGLIGGGWTTTNDSAESRIIWQQLRAAEMISGSGFAQPVNSYGGIIGVQNAIYGMTGGVMCFQTIRGDRAAVIDAKNDDGVRSTGSIRGNTSGTAYTPTTNYNLCIRL